MAALSTRAITRNRVFKITVSVSFLILTYFVTLATILPHRAFNDEALFAGDIHTLLVEGHFSTSVSYYNGSAYQIISASILKITGLGYQDLEYMSPIIGAILTSIIIVSIYKIYISVSSDPLWWVFLIFLPTLMVYPGYVKRVRQSTHKIFTFTLLFLILMLVTYVVISRHSDRRYNVLISIFLFGIVILNYVWALVYTALTIALLLLNKDNRRLRTIAFFGSIFMIVYVCVGYLPTIYSPGDFFREFTATILFGGGGTSATAAQSTSLISRWPAITILGYKFSAWYIYILGIVFTGALTALANINIALTYLRKRRVPVFYWVVFIICGTFAGMGVLFIAAADIATLKRIIVVPGAFGMLYWAVYFSNEPPEVLQKNKKIIISIILMILIVSTALSLPRVMLDGNNKPLDYYVEDSQIQKMEWYHTYQSMDEGCLKPTDKLDSQTLVKLYGDYINPDLPNGPTNKVYSSSSSQNLICDSTT